MTSDAPSAVRRALVRYLALSSIVLIVVAAASAAFASRVAVDEAVQVAQDDTLAMADRLAAPLVDDARRGDPEAVALLERLLENRMRDGSVAHIAVYTEDGTVLWSDNDRIRSKRVDLEDDVAGLFGTSRTIVDRPGEGEAHPWSDPGDEDLIEIYAGATDASGAPFVFEAYMSPDAIEENRETIFRALLPTALGMVVIFLLATLPLAIDLARRVDRAAASRSALLRASLTAMHDERRRVAQVLHDSVIQDLSAAGYAISTLTDPPPGAAALDERAQGTAERVEEIIRDDLVELRSIVGDLFPSDLAGGNLTAALGAVQSRSGQRFGLDVHLDLHAVDDLDEGQSNVVYRVVREAVTNVGKHAHATTVVVSVRRLADGVVVTVTDDGVGVSGAAGSDGEGREHLGLQLVSRELAELGGSLRLVDGPDRGAVLTAWIPVTDEP